MAKISEDYRSRQLAEFRELQAEMTRLSQEYSRERLAVWSREMADMAQTWESFQQDWANTLNHMAWTAGSTFEMISATGAATSHLLSQTWKAALADMAEEVAGWAGTVQQVLGQVSLSLSGLEIPASGGWFSWLGLAADFGGWFHQGGVVEAHRGMVVAPERLLGEEQLVIVQPGEGILPRDAMLRLGKDNFEALRTGSFDLTEAPRTSTINLNINIKAMDASEVAGLDWQRLVNRHLLPALQKELGRRW